MKDETIHTPYEAFVHDNVPPFNQMFDKWFHTHVRPVGEKSLHELSGMEDLQQLTHGKRLQLVSYTLSEEHPNVTKDGSTLYFTNDGLVINRVRPRVADVWQSLDRGVITPRTAFFEDVPEEYVRPHIIPILKRKNNTPRIMHTSKDATVLTTYGGLSLLTVQTELQAILEKLASSTDDNAKLLKENIDSLMTTLFNNANSTLMQLDNILGIDYAAGVRYHRASRNFVVSFKKKEDTAQTTTFDMADYLASPDEYEPTATLIDFDHTIIDKAAVQKILETELTAGKKLSEQKILRALESDDYYTSVTACIALCNLETIPAVAFEILSKDIYKYSYYISYDKIAMADWSKEFWLSIAENISVINAGTFSLLFSQKSELPDYFVKKIKADFINGKINAIQLSNVVPLRLIHDKELLESISNLLLKEANEDIEKLPPAIRKLGDALAGEPTYLSKTHFESVILKGLSSNLVSESCISALRDYPQLVEKKIYAKICHLLTEEIKLLNNNNNIVGTFKFHYLVDLLKETTHYKVDTIKLVAKLKSKGGQPSILEQLDCLLG